MGDGSERQVYIVSEELPSLKRKIKVLADEQDTSSTELMIRTLCKHYRLKPPPRERRPARPAEDATSLQLVVPTELWLAIHNESGVRMTSKKEVVLDVFRALVNGKRAKRW